MQLIFEIILALSSREESTFRWKFAIEIRDQFLSYVTLYTRTNRSSAGAIMTSRCDSGKNIHDHKKQHF